MGVYGYGHMSTWWRHGKELKFNIRVGHKNVWTIQDVVIFYEKLTYSKTFRSTFMKIFQKLGIPQGGSDGHYMQKWPKIVIFAHF